MVLVLIVVLIGIAFLTLLERKVLGYIQLRKGPNKVGIVGIFQPFSDALKLFRKEFMIILKSRYYLYYFCPVGVFILMIINWLTIGFDTNIYFMNYSILFILFILTIMGYIIIFIGWSSNSVYSIIGTMRVVAQTLSYEVRFIIIILIIIILRERYSFVDFFKWQLNLWYLIWLYPVFLVFFIRVLAELNRRPIDFVEGESELVSGFNIEYFRGAFALIFLAEYGIIIFFRYLITVMYTDLVFKRRWMVSLFINLIILLIIFIRGILPRMRYDTLIYLCWKVVLPFILNYLVFILGLKFIFMLLL